MMWKADERNEADHDGAFAAYVRESWKCMRADSVENPGLKADWKEEKLEVSAKRGRILDRMSVSSNFDMLERLEIGL